MSINNEGDFLISKKNIELQSFEEKKYKFKVILETKDNITWYTIHMDYDLPFLFLKIRFLKNEIEIFKEDIWYDRFSFSGKLLEKIKTSQNIDKNMKIEIGLYKVSVKGNPEIVYLNKDPDVVFL